MVTNCLEKSDDAIVQSLGETQIFTFCRLISIRMLHYSFVWVGSQRYRYRAMRVGILKMEVLSGKKYPRKYWYLCLREIGTDSVRHELHFFLQVFRAQLTISKWYKNYSKISFWYEPFQFNPTIIQILNS